MIFKKLFIFFFLFLIFTNFSFAQEKNIQTKIDGTLHFQSGGYFSDIGTVGVGSQIRFFVGNRIFFYFNPFLGADLNSDSFMMENAFEFGGEVVRFQEHSFDLGGGFDLGYIFRKGYAAKDNFLFAIDLDATFRFFNMSPVGLLLGTKFRYDVSLNQFGIFVMAGFTFN